MSSNGTLKKSFIVNNTLITNTGTALIIHAKPDDEKTDPTGGAGDRIYCAVLTEANGT